MDEIVANAIQKAADLIRAGEINSAKPLLTEILKRNDQIEQAWFLLSYTLPEHTKNIYALEQAIKINPDFDRAKKRLEKLQNRPKKNRTEQEDPADESFTKKWDVNSDTRELPNLESLFEIEDEQVEQVEQIEHVEQSDQIEISSPFYDSTFIDGDDDPDRNEDNHRPKRKFSRFRKPLLISLVIIGVLAALMYFGQQFALNISQVGTPGVESTSTLSQGFRTLPPTWTPSP